MTHAGLAGTDWGVYFTNDITALHHRLVTVRE
jgi:hypothetical protein